MDPDACWKEMVELANDVQRPDGDRLGNEVDGQRLAELVLALDDWMKKGGFAPRVFQPKTSLR